MNTGNLQRLRRARDLLAVKGYDVGGTKLACYSGAGFDPELVHPADDDPAILLGGLKMLYAWRQLEVPSGRWGSSGRTACHFPRWYGVKG